MKDHSSEPLHDSHPQPVLVEEETMQERTVQATAATKPVIHHTNYDEHFDGEYARIVPGGKSTSERGQSSGNQSDAHLENLDIPAFLRRPVS